jgi:hypothetical protein
MREEDQPPCSEQGALRNGLNGEAITRFGNIHVLQEVVKLFLSEGPERLQQIRQAIGHKDAAALRTAADALHAALGHFGRSPAMDFAAKLPSLGNQGDWISADEVYRRLDTAIHQLQPLIVAMAIEPAP